MDEQRVQHIDIFNTRISVFYDVPTFDDNGKVGVKIHAAKHRVQTIGDFLNEGPKHKTTINKTRSIMQQAIAAYNEGKESEYKELMYEYSKNKWVPPVAILQGINTTHTDKGFESYSNVLCLDIDAPKPHEEPNGNEKIFPEHLDEFKRRLAQIPWIAYCGVSAGGRGLFVLIPIADHKKHAAYWQWLETFFKNEYHVEIDGATKNLSRKRFLSYDDTAIINHHAEVFDKMPEPKRVDPSRIFKRPSFFRAKNDDEKRFIKAVAEIESKHIDITQAYDKWLKAAAAIAHTFGEWGRDYFHIIARQYPDYNEKQNDVLYTNMMKEPRGRGCTIASFFELCKQFGVDIGYHEKRVQRTSATDILRQQQAKVRTQHPDARKAPTTQAAPTPPPTPRAEDAPFDDAKVVHTFQASTMSKAEEFDLTRHQGDIARASEFMLREMQHNTPLGQLCNKLNLVVNGVNGWTMTTAQRKAIYPFVV